MNLSLQLKDYKISKTLANKQIQLTNIDSKQTYTQTTDSRGYVSFSKSLKNDRESKHETIQTEFTRLESKRDSKNKKNEVRLDSNGDEIVWSIFFGFSIYHIYNTLFGMVCFYVTNSGIGFDRRRLFGIQKNFLNLEKSK